MKRALAALVLIAARGAAAAEAEPPPHRIEGFVVDGGPAPTVQASYPKPGASIPAGELILKVVFDRPMDPDAWAYGPSAGADFPSCLAHPRLLSDRRTFVLLCTVPVNRTFALEINPAARFASAYGRLAKPFTLQFSTTDDLTDNLHDALQQAGLKDADDPIMSVQAAIRGVSETAPPP